MSRTVLKARERGHECRGPEIGETSGELSGGLTLGDRRIDLEQHRSAVESLFHAHDAHTSDGMPLEDGVLDRRGAPESWQQGCVDIDHSARWEIEQLAPENVSVGDDDAELGVEAPETGEKDISRRSLGLKHLQPRLRGGPFDRRLHEGGARAAMRLVWLGDDGSDIVPLVEQSFEGGHGELRRTEEDDPHHSGRAVSATTSLRYPVSSLRSRRQRASSIWRLIRLR